MSDVRVANAACSRDTGTVDIEVVSRQETCCNVPGELCGAENGAGEATSGAGLWPVRGRRCF